MTKLVIGSSDVFIRQFLFSDTEEVIVMEEEEMEEEIMVQDNHSDKVHKQLAGIYMFQRFQP